MSVLLKVSDSLRSGGSFRGDGERGQVASAKIRPACEEKPSVNPYHSVAEHEDAGTCALAPPKRLDITTTVGKK